MNFSKQLPQELSTHALVAERQRYYSQAVAACLARLQRAVDLLQQPLLSDVQSAGLHRDLHDQTERLNTLMRHIMAAGALGAQAAGDADWPEPVALRGVLTTLVGEYQALCSEHRYRLRLSGLPAAPAYAMPSVLIVFQLLLDNALRRAPPGEVIEIAAEDDAENTEWIFHISDKGTGLPPDRLALVFDDPSLAAPAAVYGLGLSLAKFVVEALGGRIWAASERGQGATFSFSLPRRPLPRRWIVTRPKVLVIEENTELCAALRAGYDEAGFEVETAPTAEAGLTLVPAFGPNLILLELSPGSFAGQACLATLRQCSNAAVIFLVAPDARHAVADALWQGASDCLVKPFHIRELIARTRAILRRRPAAPFADPRDAGRPRPFLFQQAKINPLLQ